MRRQIRQRLRSDKGQSFVEFTLILPIALILILGVVDLGKAMAYSLDASHLANEGARYAVVKGCPGCNPNIPTALPTAIKNQAESLQLRNAASTHVCVAYPDGSGAIGNRLKVTFAWAYDFIPFLPVGNHHINVTASSTMRIETALPGTPACST
jgi:hypothetical protein